MKNYIVIGDCDKTRPAIVYLAGPMRGIKDFNFPAFHVAATFLRSKGFEVLSPAENDERTYGADYFKSPTGDEKDTPLFNLRTALLEDTQLIIESADAVAVLPGWERSSGALTEVSLARALRLPVFSATTLDDIIAMPDSSGQITDEVRITDPDTGGQKGQKIERFDLIPVEPLEELARVYGKGAQKYADDNWRKGYSWKLSFGAMMRHAWLFWRGEFIDKDTGCHHLACVAWHCFTLMWFEKHRPEKDDRPDCKA
jgi:hypothetical protein